MSVSHPKFTKAFGILVSPWTLVIAIFLTSIWALTGESFSLSNNWRFAINLSLSVLTLFILWRISRKPNHEAKAIRMKIDEAGRRIKSTKDERSGQNGNGSKTGELQRSIGK